MTSNKTLVIVESPSKCKKIHSYLGKDYKVIASFGHFTKLCNLEQINYDTYDIMYKVDKPKVLKTLREETAKAKEVLIATDDDREGEAIGWSICMFCHLNLSSTKKIVFQEITKSAILHAIQNPRYIDMNIVKSQQSRQIVDLYLGYKISPLLWKFIQHKLSAGRCQTPALKLIWDNEQEFSKDDERNRETSYKIYSLFTSKRIQFQCMQTIRKCDIEKYMKVMQHITEWSIQHYTQVKKTEKPPKVLITSTLQQMAYNVLRFSPKATMKYAQELYENGLITYMRTDSMCYSLEFIHTTKEYIKKQYGDAYVNPNIENLRNNKNKNKSQEAHEGIRVCDLNKCESNVKTEQANKLYRMIYRHSVQSCMSDFEYNEFKYIAVPVHIDDTKYNKHKFEHIETSDIFLGWKKVNDIASKNNTNNITSIPYLNKLYEDHTVFDYLSCWTDEKLTINKSHYNEASLIKRLETMNIGRPSTFSNIIHSLLERGYVDKTNIKGTIIQCTNYNIDSEKVLTCDETEKEMNGEKNKLKITQLGDAVCRFCYDKFPELFDYGFTEKMENWLDDIGCGVIMQSEVLNDYIKNVDMQIKNASDYFENHKDQIQKIKSDNSIHCGKYNNKAICIKHGKYGYYVSYYKKGERKLSNLSLKGFDGFDIEERIKEQSNSIDENERALLMSYIEKSSNMKNENCVVDISKDCSIRRSKYGLYIFHKDSSMKKPKFYKFNDEKSDEVSSWVDTKNSHALKAYIVKKYNLNI
jgi:DNA topoisomerase-1